MKSNCLNCGTPLDGNFCQHCGQQASTGKIRFSQIIGDYLNAAFSLDGQFLKTILLLTSNPGKLFREYLAGRRKTYYNPVALYLLLTFFYFLVKSFFSKDLPLSLDQTKSTNLIPLIDNQNLEATLSFISGHLDYILILFVFITALILKLLFRTYYSFSEYIAVSFFIISSYLCLTIIFFLLSELSTIGTSLYRLPLLLIVCSYSIYSFLKKKDITSILKYIFTPILSFILYFGLSISFVYAIISFS